MSPRRSRRREEPERGDLRTGGAMVETHPDGDWMVRYQPASRAAKAYRCPGCDQVIAPTLAHVVAWRPGHEDDRRHWHTPCWRARGRRGADVQRSRNAPRYG
jgi:hypothetical protein